MIPLHVHNSSNNESSSPARFLHARSQSRSTTTTTTTASSSSVPHKRTHSRTPSFNMYNVGGSGSNGGNGSGSGGGSPAVINNRDGTPSYSLVVDEIIPLKDCRSIDEVPERPNTFVLTDPKGIRYTFIVDYHHVTLMDETTDDHHHYYLNTVRSSSRGNSSGSSGSSTGASANNRTHQQQQQQHISMKKQIRLRQDWVFCILLYLKGANEYRYSSFAPVRLRTRTRWYVDGREGFLAIARAIENAREQVFITGWMLSPLLPLVRDDDPSCTHFRLDTLLKRKASQGVHIFVMIWKETAIVGLNLESYRVKRYLKSLHRNIHAITAPRKFPVEWSHHQKTVVVDQSIALLGGLDMGWGRYDDLDHRITDNNHCRLTWPGNDYCLPSVKGFLKFNNKLDAFSDAVDRDYHARMAWHDVHCSVTGEAAADVARNFIQRWNYQTKARGTAKELVVKNVPPPIITSSLNPFSGITGRNIRDKWQTLKKKSQLSLPHIRSPIDHSTDAAAAQQHHDEDEETWVNSDDTSDSTAASSLQQQNPNLTRMLFPSRKRKGSSVSHSKLLRDLIEKEKGKSYNKNVPDEGFYTKCQVLRSITNWSGGGRTERSIMEAYIDLINKAKHYIYIENQYFISSTAGRDVVKNTIVEHLTNRIRRAIRDKETFRVFVILPNHPDGNLAESSLQQVMKWQARTINRSQTSILQTLTREFPNVDLEQYIGFFCLRSYGFLSNDHIYEDLQQFVHDEMNDDDTYSAATSTYSMNHQDVATNYTGLRAVTEQIYVHCKLLIVDDLYTIIGSANLNDRSMLGDRDSEIAIITEDEEFYSTKMNGNRYKAGKFAFSLRMRLWREHLGLFEEMNDGDDDEDMEDAENTQQFSMRKKLKDTFDKQLMKTRRMKIREAIIDPISSKTYERAWLMIAKRNTQIYETVFPSSMPSNKFKTVKAYYEAKNNQQKEYKDKLNDLQLQVQSEEDKRFMQLLQEREEQEKFDGNEMSEDAKILSAASLQVDEEVAPTTSSDVETPADLTSTDHDESQYFPSKKTYSDTPIHQRTLSLTGTRDEMTASSILTPRRLREDEQQKRQALSKIQGHLCMYPLHFCHGDKFTKSYQLKLVVDDDIFI